MRPILVIILALLSACGGSGGNTNESAEVGNRAPSISGSPADSVTVGDPYSFTPAANDPDGDSLSFSTQNLPGWTSFDTASGTISGTPSNADIGVHSNIIVSVSDGQVSASLPGFGIDVTQIGPASTTLSWTAPTRNNDGTALTDLAGYVIYYGTTSGSYSNEIRIDNPGITSHVVDGLTGGTYYFAAKSFNSAGVESGFSGEASATLAGP